MDRLIDTVFRLKSKYIDRDAQLLIRQYYDFTMAIEVVSPKVKGAKQGEVLATISVNHENSINLIENRFYGKNYSENAGLLECIEEAGLIKYIGDGVQSGFCMLPLYELLV